VKNEYDNQEYTTSEWTHEEWERQWHLDVGTAYHCEKCGSVIMITKGGVGTLEPYCCGELMLRMETEKK
jgi:hypothetical protein